MPLPRSWASGGGGEGGERRKGRAKTIGSRIKVQGALDKRAAFRRGFVKLDQPVLMERAAAAAATDTARWTETG